MKTSLINKTIIALIILSIIASTSCKKQETAAKLPETNQVQAINKAPWIPIIVGVVYVIVHAVEGQCYKEVTYNPDGTVASIKEGCKGWGSCSVIG